MNRRGFLRMGALAPVAAAAAVIPGAAYATGGFVQGPAGVALIGDLGPEAIVPLTRLRTAGEWASPLRAWEFSRVELVGGGGSGGSGRASHPDLSPPYCEA